MLIPDPAMIQGKKSMIFLMILEILKDSSDIDHPMLKEELRSMIHEKFGFLPARNNIYDKLNALVEAGFPIVQDDKGVYYDGAVLSDGELRFLADCVLYSDFATHRAAADIIEALSALGSHEFQKYMKKQVYRTTKTRKNPRLEVFLNLERVQQAIFDQHQISCNFLSYTAEMQTELVYPENIVINPYDIVYKNGKYYLFGALPDSEKMLSWRLDRLCNFKDLENRRTDIPLLKEIEACGGMSAYVDAQPDLCGGVVETFKLQCFRDSVDEVVDAFGSDFRIAPEQSENYDSETVIVIVRTTWEAMKAWAFTHAGSIVVIAPEDFREELQSSLRAALSLYNITGRPMRELMHRMRDLDKAVRFAVFNHSTSFSYIGNEQRRKNSEIRIPEPIDISVLKPLSDLSYLHLRGCDLGNDIFTPNYPKLKTLHLPFCNFNPDNLSYSTELEELSISYADNSFLSYLKGLKSLVKLEMTRCSITDLSFLSEMNELRELELYENDAAMDYTTLQSLSDIRCLHIGDADTNRDWSFLTEMKNLKQLFITSPCINDEFARKLQAALPDCRVKIDIPNKQ